VPELPWDKWFPTNWASEPGLRLCDAATRGIWFEALNTMMLMQSYEVSGTIEEICALLSCRQEQAKLAILQLKVFKVAEVIEQNGNIKIASRRRKRAYNISELRSQAGKASATKRQQAINSLHEHIPQHGAPTPSSSSSSSLSASAYSETPSWEEFWEYCQGIHCGIAAEWYAKDKYWAANQDRWNKKSDWRSYARRVRGWWDNDGRPMTPPKKNGAPTKQPTHILDATYDSSKDPR